MTGHDEQLERELAAWLREEAPTGAPAELRRTVLTDSVRAPQRSRWPLPELGRSLRPALGLMASAVAVVVVAVLALALLSSAPTGPAASSPTPTATAGAGPTHYPVVTTFAGVTTFPVLVDGSIWAPQWDLGTVVRIDTATNELLATIPVGERPHAMAARGSEVWVSARDDEGWAVLRLDPETNQVAERIAVDDQGWGMAIVGDTMWLTSFESSRVKRIDLAARQVVAEVRLNNSLGIAATEDDVWVALGGIGSVARIDPVDNELTIIRTGTRTTTMPLIVDDELWLTTLDSGQLMVISRETNEVLERIELNYPMGLARQGDLIWVTDDSVDEQSSAARLVAIDIATREIVHVLPMPGTGVDRAITVDGDTIWLVGNGLMRVDISGINGN